MEEFDRYVRGMVREMQRERNARGLMPDAVSMNDIKGRLAEDLRQSLNRAVQEGVMTWYPNLNKMPMFSVKY